MEKKKGAGTAEYIANPKDGHSGKFPLPLLRHAPNMLPLRCLLAPHHRPAIFSTLCPVGRHSASGCAPITRDASLLGARRCRDLLRKIDNRDGDVVSISLPSNAACPKLTTDPLRCCAQSSLSFFVGKSAQTGEENREGQSGTKRRTDLRIETSVEVQ